MILFFAGMLCFPVYGQIERARKEMSLFHYADAIGYLHKSWAKGDGAGRAETARLMGTCYRKQQNWERAREWYAIALESGDTVTESFFWIAQALRITGDYPEARIRFLVYDSLNPGDPRGRLYADWCDSAIFWLRNPPSYTVYPVSSLNTPQSEFGAVVYPGGIMFASDRALPSRQERIYNWTGRPYLRLFTAAPEIRGNYAGGYLPAEPAPGFFNQEWHDGPVSFNGNFTEAFLNRTLVTSGKGKKDPGHVRTHLLKLYSFVRSDDKWTRPRPFFLNNDTFSIGHPALSPGGDTLIFVSDMNGGYGGTDLYRCIRSDGSWGSPENLGPALNTPGNEMFPFLAADGSLWFSSDGWPGFGGLDIFHSAGSGRGWSHPENPGAPLNSSWDDFSVSLLPASEEGFFSSNRPGGTGSDDIYRFRRTKEEELRAQGTELREKGSGQSDQDKGQTRFPATPLPHDTLLELNKPYLLENIYYDFDRWEIRQDARPALDSLVGLMKRFPVTIELGSHTDCRGSYEYNQELSQKRAESAVSYIISRGINPKRITARGYGKTMLINRCTCTEVPPCSEAGHQQNRRTEFRILSFTPVP